MHRGTGGRRWRHPLYRKAEIIYMHENYMANQEENDVEFATTQQISYFIKPQQIQIRIWKIQWFEIQKENVNFTNEWDDCYEPSEVFLNLSYNHFIVVLMSDDSTEN